MNNQPHSTSDDSVAKPAPTESQLDPVEGEFQRELKAAAIHIDKEVIRIILQPANQLVAPILEFVNQEKISAFNANKLQTLNAIGKLRAAEEAGVADRLEGPDLFQ